MISVLYAEAVIDGACRTNCNTGSIFEAIVMNENAYSSEVLAIVICVLFELINIFTVVYTFCAVYKCCCHAK